MMTNLTINVDAETLKKARLRAMADGRSVNAILREYLELYSGHNHEQREALSELLDLAKGNEAGSGGRRWTRDELHERD